MWLLVGFHPATQSVQSTSLPIMPVKESCTGIATDIDFKPPWTKHPTQIRGIHLHSIISSTNELTKEPNH